MELRFFNIIFIISAQKNKIEKMTNDPIYFWEIYVEDRNEITETFLKCEPIQSRIQLE